MCLNKFTIQKSFTISAGAGSGKTYTLSRRYINALLGFDYFREDYKIDKSYFEDLKPAKVNQIVTITYTEAAEKNAKYQEQLDFYRDAVEQLGYKVVDIRLLWLGI